MKLESSTGLVFQNAVEKYFQISVNSTSQNSTENFSEDVTNSPSSDSDDSVKLEVDDVVNNPATVLPVTNEFNSKNISELEFNLNTTTNLNNSIDLKPQNVNIFLNANNSKKGINLKLQKINERLMKYDKILNKTSSENSKRIDNLQREVQKWLSTLTELVLINTKIKTTNDVKCREPCEDHNVKTELTLKQRYLAKKLRSLVQEKASTHSPFAPNTNDNQSESKSPRKKLPLIED
ncbi:hypothetical protein PV327_005885 [Microctonus hyperodae]|uniref:Uncharacterized protein n=1 Tax=Microctonus hyperodae TaxID=165561 RepID=A0AA39L065_MICHY|nr:hypothetical protein PV327_005885 [Microctonus hyperodae]